MVSFQDFVGQVQGFQKRSIVDGLTTALWKIYKDQGYRRRNYQGHRVITAFAPRIIILAMAAGTDLGRRTFTANDVEWFCARYLDVGALGTLSEANVDREANEILVGLRERLIIPTQHLQLAWIRHSCPSLFMSRILNAQHETNLVSHMTFVREYQIFQIWDRANNGEPTVKARATFQLEPIQFFRAAFMLFAMGNAPAHLGRLPVTGLNADNDIRALYNVDSEAFRKVAEKLCRRESQLPEWYKAWHYARHSQQMQQASALSV